MAPYEVNASHLLVSRLAKGRMFEGIYLGKSLPGFKRKSTRNLGCVHKKAGS